MKKVSRAGKYLLLFLVLISVFTLYSQTLEKCGTWRWDVKTLTDNSGINWLAMNPVDSKIETLVSETPPVTGLSTSDINGDGKLPRFESEKTLVKLFAYVKEVKKEKDNDLHMVLESTESETEMVGEIPDPNCPNFKNFPDLIERFTAVRKAGDQVKALLKKSDRVMVELEGVPFWDATHGQTGGASNGREIHPITFLKILNEGTIAALYTGNDTANVPAAINQPTNKTEGNIVMPNTPLDILVIILLGAILGTVGQGMRVVIGLKKMNDEANKPENADKNLYKNQQLITSLFIAFAVGAIAGVLAAVAKIDVHVIDKSTIIAFITAGYAGTDFIEGFMNKNKFK